MEVQEFVSAHGATPSGAPEVEIQLGHACTNRCVFCGSGRLNDAGTARLIETQTLVDALEAAKQQGCRRVTLLGGEPTIHPGFLDVLARAQELGFPEIIVFTNGARLARNGFLDRVLELGPVMWRVSVQGPNAAVHDAVTGREGSFDRMARSLDMLRDRGQSVTVNTCATRLNLESLPKLAGIAARFQVKAWHLDMVRPEDTGDLTPERLRRFLPTYSEMSGPLRAMLEAMEVAAPNVQLSLGNYPFCLLPEWADRIHHGGQATRVCDAGGGTSLGSPRDKYPTQLSARIRPDACEGCVFIPRCSGAPTIYLDLFGDSELRAVSFERLIDVDNRVANLPLLLRPWVDLLLRVPPPHPWVLGEVTDYPRERAVEVPLSHPSTGHCSLRLLPRGVLWPGSQGTALLTSAVAELHLVGSGDERDTGTAELTHWVRQQAREVGPPIVRSPTATSVRNAQGHADAARVDIKIGFACNNRCEFCVQGNKRERHGPRPLEQIRTDLEEGRQRGASGIVITGGEPSIHATILEVAALAREMGYSGVQIQSNGRLFAYRPFCEDSIAAGANEFALALHGARAETHDRLTRAPGAFRQTVAGIRNLVQLGQRVLANTVITSVNYRELPDIARLLVKLGVSQYQFAFVHILGTAAKNASWLVPRKSDVMPFVKAGLDVGLRAGVRSMTEAIPFCFMSGYEDCVAEQIIPRTVVFDAEVTLDDYTSYRQTEGKAKGPNCGQCLYFDRCEGPWVEYPELFGWDELCPVKTKPDVPASVEIEGKTR